MGWTGTVYVYEHRVPHIPITAFVPAREYDTRYTISARPALPEHAPFDRAWVGDVFFDGERGQVDPAEPLVDGPPYLLVEIFEDASSYATFESVSVQELADVDAVIAGAHERIGTHWTDP